MTADLIGDRDLVDGTTRVEQVVFRVMRSLVVWFARVFWRVEYIGANKLPTSGPYLLAPIHRSNIDSLLACGLTPRRQRFLGKDSVWRNSPKFLIHDFLFALGGFPVARGTPDREAMRLCIDILDSGQPLVVFPEGERRQGPIIEDLYDGPAYIAAKAGVPIFPVGIGGSARAMPPGDPWLHRSKVVYVIGDPIPPPPRENGRIPRRSIHELTLTLERTLQELFDDAQRRAGDVVAPAAERQVASGE